MPHRDVLRSIRIRHLAVWFLIGASSLARNASGEPSRLPSASLTLEWTAPGDDGYRGVASGYDLRYSFEPITPENFDRATPVTEVPAPGRPGVRDRVTVTRLMPETHYFFALRTVDDSGNWSTLSNVPRVKTANPLAIPPPPLTLTLAPPYPNPARNGAAFEAALPRQDRIHMEVFDPSGRRVKTLAYDEYPAGTNVFRWDLRDTNGAPLEDGIYWVRVTTRSAIATRRFTISR